MPTVPPSTPVRPMQSMPAASSGPPISIDDVYYVVFRHKWKILICTVLGLGAAVAFYFTRQPPAESDAMLFIRYVMEASTPGLPGSDSRAVSPDMRGETIINTEVQILSSLDLAEQVVDAIGTDKILANVKGPKERGMAAGVVRSGLVITPLHTSSVIELSFFNADPTLVQPVLKEIVAQYIKKHLEVHRGAGVDGDFLSQETDQLRSRLTQTEDELRKAKDKAGITSLGDAEKSYTDQIARLSGEIFTAEAEYAERSTMLQDLAKRAPAAAPAAASPAAPAAPQEPAVPADQVDEYHRTVARLQALGRYKMELLTEFTEANSKVQAATNQINEAQATRAKLEAKYPALTHMAVPVPTAPGTAAPAAATAPGATIDFAAEAARLAGLQSKIKVLHAELDQVKAEQTTVDKAEGTISDLQRQREMEDAHYRYYAEHLQAAQIDEALGAGRALNIAEIQTPTPPLVDWKKTYKTISEIAASGLIFGLAWAFLIEYYFDRSIRRPKDIEVGLKVPLFLSVPDFGKSAPTGQVFHETLRDRLIGYFESQGLKHKPKLIAITAVGPKAGVTTTAAGLAHSLSDTGEGNVLLVDMTVSQGSAQQFYKGNAVRGLDELLSTGNSIQPVHEKLFVVGSEEASEKLSRALPSRFNQLIPQLKGSDFDYIIFDMPPVNQISITPRLAVFMDMVLLVIESEHTNKELASQAVTLLARSRAHVGAVITKTKNYLPSKAAHRFLGAS